MNLHALIAVYGTLMLMDFLFMLCLHFFHDRKGYYKTASCIWAGLLMAFVADGFLAERFHNIHHVFGISFTMITSFSIAKLVSDIYKFDFPWRAYAKFSLMMWLAGALSHFVLNVGFTLSALCICIGIVAPLLKSAYLILRQWRNLTIIDRFFGLLILAEGVHLLDYPFFRNIESAPVFGFSLGMLIVYFVSMLVPVVINRRISSEFSETLQKEVEVQTKKLEDAQEHLIISSKFAALGEMAGGIAHEVNTPLGVIRLRAQQLGRLLSQPQFDRDQAKDMVRAIESTTDRIDKIIQGLRAFSRNSADDPMAKEDLKQMVRDALELCQQRIINGGISIRMLDIPSLPVKCHSSQIVQVLINILQNACDAIEGLPQRWIEISAQATQDSADIRITDSGAGILPEVEKKLFQPFISSKPIGKGTGLGLSISKGVIEQHGGSLFYDAVGEHTCFVIRLPCWIAAEKGVA